MRSFEVVVKRVTTKDRKPDIGKFYSKDALKEARRLIKQGAINQTIKNKTGVDIKTIHKLRQRIQEDMESQRAKDGGKVYIVKDCAFYLGSRFEEKSGMYWLDNLPATIGEVITAANEVLAKRNGEGRLGRNPAWWRKAKPIPAEHVLDVSEGIDSKLLEG